MAVAATRNEVKDSETSAGIVDLSRVDSNSVLNTETRPTQSTAGDDVIEGGPTKEDRTLKNNKMKEGAKKLLDKVKNTAKEKITVDGVKKKVAKQTKEAANRELEKRYLGDVPGLLKSAVAAFKSGGKTDILNVLNDALHAGLKYYCYKTGRIKTRTGLGINSSLMGGHIGRRSMSLIDELCLAVENGELEGSNTIRALEIITKWSIQNTKLGKIATLQAAGNTAIASAITKKLPFGAVTDPEFVTADQEPLLSLSQFADKIRDAEFEGALANLQIHEIDEYDRDLYIEELDNRMETLRDNHDVYDPEDPKYKEYSNYLIGRGRVTTMPLVSAMRTHYKNKYSNYKDSIGRMYRSLLITDMGDMIFPGMSEGHRQMLDYLERVKKALSDDPDFITRDNRYGSFDDYDFEWVMPDNLFPNPDYGVPIEFKPKEYVVRELENGRTYTLQWNQNEDIEYVLTSDAIEITEEIPNFQPMMDLIDAAEYIPPTYLINDLDVTTCIGMGYYD